MHRGKACGLIFHRHARSTARSGHPLLSMCWVRDSDLRILPWQKGWEDMIWHEDKGPDDTCMWWQVSREKNLSDELFTDPDNVLNNIRDSKHSRVFSPSFHNMLHAFFSLAWGQAAMVLCDLWGTAFAMDAFNTMNLWLAELLVCCLPSYRDPARGPGDSRHLKEVSWALHAKC